jgi:uncharacterized membrane protein YphA (DoxX/SURF4 family)
MFSPLANCLLSVAEESEMMSNIFISYVNDDRTRVEPLAEALESQGWSVWWDRIIPAGKTFDEVIDEAINDASCIVVIWSEKSISSRWVRTEAEEGANRNILVPVLIDSVKIPLSFRRIQAANLTGWQGNSQHPGFKQLVKDISGLIGPPHTPQAAESLSDGRIPAPTPDQRRVEGDDPLAKDNRQIEAAAPGRKADLIAFTNIPSLNKFYSKWSPYGLSILRIVVAFLYMQYGMQKLFNVPVPLIGYSIVPPSLVIAGVLEVFGGLLLLLGLLTRPVAFILAGEMAVAYFYVHARQGFWPIQNGGTLAVLYCFMFLYFVLVGAGPWSIDRLWLDGTTFRKSGRA